MTFCVDYSYFSPVWGNITFVMKRISLFLAFSKKMRKKCLSPSAQQVMESLKMEILKLFLSQSVSLCPWGDCMRWSVLTGSQSEVGEESRVGVRWWFTDPSGTFPLREMPPSLGTHTHTHTHTESSLSLVPIMTVSNMQSAHPASLYNVLRPLRKHSWGFRCDCVSVWNMQC